MRLGASGDVAGRSILRSQISVIAESVVARSVYSLGGGGADSLVAGSTGLNCTTA